MYIGGIEHPHGGWVWLARRNGAVVGARWTDRSGGRALRGVWAAEGWRWRWRDDEPTELASDTVPDTELTDDDKFARLLKDFWGELL